MGRKKKAKPPRRTPGVPMDLFIEAMRNCGGIKHEMATKLGVSRQAVHKRIKASKKLQALHRETIETNLDRAELVILDGIKAGNSKDAKFYLDRQGKARGYGAIRHEVTGVDGEPIRVLTAKDLTDDELVEIVKGKRK